MGINTCLKWSLLIIIAFIHPFPWIHIKPYMVGGVGLLLGGLKWVSLLFFVSILFIRLWIKFILEGIACKRPIVGKSLMTIIGEGI